MLTYEEIRVSDDTPLTTDVFNAKLALILADQRNITQSNLAPDASIPISVVTNGLPTTGGTISGELTCGPNALVGGLKPSVVKNQVELLARMISNKVVQRYQVIVEVQLEEVTIIKDGESFSNYVEFMAPDGFSGYEGRIYPCQLGFVFQNPGATEMFMWAEPAFSTNKITLTGISKRTKDTDYKLQYNVDVVWERRGI